MLEKILKIQLEQRSSEIPILLQSLKNPRMTIINRFTRKFAVEATLILIHYLSIFWTAFSSYNLIDSILIQKTAYLQKTPRKIRLKYRINGLGIVQQSPQLSRIVNFEEVEECLRSI